MTEKLYKISFTSKQKQDAVLAKLGQFMKENAEKVGQIMIEDLGTEIKKKGKAD